MDEKITSSTLTETPSGLPSPTVGSPEEEAALPEQIRVDIRSRLEAIHRLTQETFQQELKESGGAGPWLRSRCPVLTCAEASPLTLSEADLDSLVLSETRSFWTGIETRLAECGTCKPDGAACQATSDRLPPGVRVALRVGSGSASASMTRCERYREFRIADRLERAGVDRAYWRVKFSELSVSASARESFREWLAGEGLPIASLLLLGEQASACGAALIRNALSHFPTAVYRSVHVPSLIRECRSRMTAQESSPLDELLTPHVLVLDGVERYCLKNKYFMPEIQWAFGRRRDRRLATIITSGLPQAREAFPFARVVEV